LLGPLPPYLSSPPAKGSVSVIDRGGATINHLS